MLLHEKQQQKNAKESKAPGGCGKRQASKEKSGLFFHHGRFCYLFS